MNRSTPTPCLLLSLGLSACTTVDLGKGPEFLWWADHETGDTSEWTADSGGYAWSDAGGTIDVISSPAHSGRFALRASVTTSTKDKPSSGLISRNVNLPNEAFYSAWFFVPSVVAITDYWLFFKFRSRTNAASANTVVDFWDLDLRNDSVNGLGVRLYHHDLGDVPALVPTNVPVGEWFQAEAYLRAASDISGQLTIWIDGTLVFDVTGRVTAPSPWLEWSVGGATELSPSATLYVDDAAITSERLGPSVGPFWRGD